MRDVTLDNACVIPLLAIWSRAHRDDEDGDHARETLGEITEYALEIVAN